MCITRYGNGHWSSYQDLTQKIAAHNAATRSVPPASATQQPGLIRPSTTARPAAQLAPSSALGNRNGSQVISNDGGSLISDAGGNQLNRNNAIISQDGNGLVSNSSGTMRSVQSVDTPRAPAGKYLVIPGGNLVDANGNIVRKAGTYMLLSKNGSYTIGTGAGARTPTSGTVVNP